MYMVIVAYHKPYVDDIYHNTALRWLFSINHLFVFLARNKTHCVLMLFASPIKIGVSNWNVGSINQCCLGKKTLLKMDILGLHVKNMANWIVGSINQFIEAVSVRKLSLKKNYWVYKYRICHKHFLVFSLSPPHFLPHNTRMLVSMRTQSSQHFTASLRAISGYTRTHKHLPTSQVTAHNLFSLPLTSLLVLSLDTPLPRSDQAMKKTSSSPFLMWR